MTHKRLWAPWRSGYISTIVRKKVPLKGCIFCQKHRAGVKEQRREYILMQGRLSFSLLNRYPYNAGHLMIAPYRHVGRLESLTKEEQLEIFELINDAIARLERSMKPTGFNVGVNLGRAAGAGIPGHLHFPIVPRWDGDINFMPTLADTKVISQSLTAVYRLLKRSGPSSAAKKRR